MVVESVLTKLALFAADAAVDRSAGMRLIQAIAIIDTSIAFLIKHP
jgi:hypothetical protein